MRQGNEGTERGQVIRISLRGTSGVKSSLLRQLAVHLRWKKLGKKELGGGAGGKDHLALRASKQNKKNRTNEGRSRKILSGAEQQLCLMSSINKPRA